MTEPRARFRDLFAAEWIKLWSLRSTPATLAVVVLAVTGFSANAALADYNNWPTYNPDRRALFNPLHDAFPQQAYLFLMLVTASLGALAIAGEYSTGSINSTFTAVPARASVAGAKMAVVTAVMCVLGALTATGSFLVSQAILSGRDAGYPPGDPGALRAIAASALLAPVCALVGMGIGALVRHTAGTIVTATVVLLSLPYAFDEGRHWKAVVYHSFPLAAWNRLIENDSRPTFMPSDYPATVTGSWLVFAIWPLAAAAVAVIVTHRRDPG
jgi:ABC-type transport system involved in multi-copper enzyme maturation permease subunit